MASREHKRAALNEKLQQLRAATNSNAVITIFQQLWPSIYSSSSSWGAPGIWYSNILISNSSLFDFLLRFVSLAAEQSFNYSRCIQVYKWVEAKSGKTESRYWNFTKFKISKFIACGTYIYIYYNFNYCIQLISFVNHILPVKTTYTINFIVLWAGYCGNPRKGFPY